MDYEELYDEEEIEIINRLKSQLGVKRTNKLIRAAYNVAKSYLEADPDSSGDD